MLLKSEKPRSDAHLGEPADLKKTFLIVSAWAPRLLQFGLVQLVSQGLMFLAGLVIIRSSEKADYAAYTLATSAVAIMGNLSSSGIAGSVMAIGGRLWQDEGRLQGLVDLAASLRLRMLALAAAGVLPFVAWSLLRQGVSKWLLAFVLLAAFAVTALQAAYALQVQRLRLRGELRTLQRLELAGATVRLLASVGAALMAILKAPVALAINGLGVLAQSALLRRYKCGTTVTPKIDIAHRAEMMANIRRQVPNEIYYALSSQFTLWLLAVFGSAESVAHFGALGRIAIVFGILGSVLEGIVIPAYVKAQTRAHVSERFFMIFGMYCAVAFLPFLACSIFPSEIIAMLGPKYVGLEHQFLLIVLSSTLGAVNGMTWSLNASRGWILPSPINISVGILAQLLAVAMVDVRTVTGAVEINLVTFIACIFTNVLFWYTRVRHLPVSVEVARAS